MQARTAATARVKLTWLANHGIRIEHRRGRSITLSRYEPPGGDLSVLEAAAALVTYPVRLYRLIESGRLRARWSRGKQLVRLAEVRRVLKDPTVLADRRKGRKGGTRGR